ncbi:MAG: glutamine synthetase [Actinobacteria bacterium 13_2_20CM_2_71_6]|nr:MAG: glutamine synthetase [Actinobacteria bacterium 13_2_20CM_2_71_6]
MGQEQHADRAREAAVDLTGRGVRTVALTFVDNAGLTRVKSVPVNRLEHAARWGVGMSPVFDVFCVDDSVTTSRHIGGPAGDLRLYPDLDRLTVLAAQPGWAWAPVDRRTQEDEPYPGCQRTFARTMAARAAERGLELRMAFEVEWFVGSGDLTPACQGPAYGMTRLVELSEYIDAVLAALAAQRVPVEQFHPEYAPGQLELSVAAADPVAAADRTVLVRQTIRAVSHARGYQVSFAPVVVAGRVGNGAHLHFSPWSAGVNLFTGGDRPYGLRKPGESILAGLLERLPALTAIGAPSPASYLRLVPQHWAGPWQCWGRENREAALRLITGTVGERERAANAELKCFDGSANPYLLVGAVTAVATAALSAGLELPPEVPDDPALLPEEQQPPRLPRSLPDALDALRADDVLPDALGEPLLEAFCAVRRAEHELFAGAKPEDIAEGTRWKY